MRFTHIPAAGLFSLLFFCAGQSAFGQGQTVQDFDGGGTAFTNAGSASTAAAVTGNAGQLTPLSNNQTGRIGFDQSLSGTDFDLISGSFDFRAQPNTEGSNQADGFSLLFLPTADHGTSGDFGMNGAAEFGRADNAVGIGFNIHNGGPDISNNSIYVNLDEDPATATQVAAPFDISTSEFHRANFTLEFLESGDALLDLVLTEDINGTPGPPQSVFDDLLLPGITPFDFRIGFGGRTGGQNALQQIDNINITASLVPEPGSIAIWSLLGLGFAAVGGRRLRWKR